MKLIAVIASVLAISGVLAGPVPNAQADETEKVPITFEDTQANRLGLRGFGGTWISGERYLFTEGSNIKVRSAETLIVDDVFSLADLDLKWSSYSISPSWNKLLIRHDVRQIFRHSTVAKFAIVQDVQNEKPTIIHIANGAELSTCIWAPKTDRLAFVRNNDVYVRNEAGVEMRLTTDGVSGEIYNGVADWVYEEEILATSAAMWFSPDGNQLAYVKFVDTNVEEFTYYMYGEPGEIEDQYPEAIKLRYPKSGSTNPTIQLLVRDISQDQLGDEIELLPPTSLANQEPILGAITWTTDTELVTFWMNRRQNKAIFQKCSVTTNACENIVSFEEPSGWIKNVRPICSDDGTSCVIIAGDNKWFKAVKIDLVAKTKTALTADGMTVQTIYGTKENDLYYLGVEAERPEQRHVYKNQVCLTCDVKDVNSVACTYASASFSQNFNYYLLSCSGPTPSFVQLRTTASNNLKLSLEDNVAAREKLATFQTPIVHYLEVEVAGGFHASVRMKVPMELDITAATFPKKYPMIVNVYGGPDTVRAVDSFSFGYEEYMVSSRKVIFVSIDGRGCSNKGLDMTFAVNNKLGTVEIEDQIAVAKKLQDMFSFIDAERSGIWGWSYGGYATAMALAKDTERVFQCGISVAPVTSWIYYDTMYTERYMDTPENNKAGYNASDVTWQLEQFKYHDFMLIHGNADDNVHYQQAMALSRALQEENIMFEQMSYPDEAHGLTGVTNHLYHTMTAFWEKCLSLDD